MMKAIVIQNMYNQYRHSVMQGLTGAVTELCCESFQWDNRFGQTLDRDKLVADLSAGRISYANWVSDIKKVSFFDEDYAVLTSMDTITSHGDHPKQVFEIFVTAVFAKREKGWKLICGQSTTLSDVIS
ncbi:MAG: nuclear transport factor 2 family protein [Oscillospiraceae bacterium]|nr:nuclear transport factor 2 family protein [Oscillospiraceae bacterium]